MPDTILSVTSHSNGSPLTTVQAGPFLLKIDEPEAFGGANTAPSPVLYMLAAIAGCVHAAGRIAAEDMRFALKEMRVRVEGPTNSDRFFMKETEDRSGFRRLVVSIEAETDEPQARMDAWLEQIRYRCPVTDTIAWGTPLEYALSRISGVANRS